MLRDNKPIHIDRLKYIPCIDVGMSVDRKRLESYLEDYKDDSQQEEGMGLKVENYEGGGNNMPDESTYYESRLEWLNDDKNGLSGSIWVHLAQQEFKNVTPSETEELVFIKFPAWLAEMDDNEDWRATFGEIYGYHTGWAMLDVGNSEGKNAWAFNKFYIDGRWRAPRNEYSKIWGPRSCFTIYRQDGEPNNVDKENVNQSEALPDGIDVFEAEDDDYDWRYALGAAYRRTTDEENDPLKEAELRANELPDKLYKRVEIGLDEYMRQSKAEGEEVSDKEMAKVINTLTTAIEPGAVAKSENK